ncbi:MAG: dihydrodipicolinate synthase family protein [Calditrichia bacterium]|nr:dihydrodipicolinate synthase family protein [Calditrichota bacterium]MCB0269696.1 dihydrodipicolinate synthase family protein [Calditrichota bacterium]
MATKWEGVYPAVTTKFTADFKLDHPAMEKNFQAQLDAGVHGLICCGSLGENGVLSAEEKIEVLKTAVNVSAGKVPVILTIAETTTAAACEMAKQGVKNGADGFMLLPPMRYTSDERETVVFLEAVAAVSERPIMIYNNPVAYNIDVTPQMFADLAKNDTFVALKESSDNVRRITDIKNYCGDRYQIFTGVDNLALESLLMGADGWVAGLVCAFPRETVVIYELAKQNRIAEALEIYRWFKPVLDLDVSTKLVQNIKLAEQMTGLGNENVRPPRLPLIGEERQKVVQTLQKALDSRPVMPNL